MPLPILMNRRTQRKNLLDIPIDDAITNRVYQKEAIRAVCDQIELGFRKHLLVMAPGTGKGASVKWLTEHLGFKREETMGFGDFTNDLPMLENVGWPVAVGNAIDEVKAACRIIAPHCAEDGVAKTIQKYVLGDEEA